MSLEAQSASGLNFSSGSYGRTMENNKDFSPITGADIDWAAWELGYKGNAVHVYNKNRLCSMTCGMEESCKNIHEVQFFARDPTPN